MRDAVARAFRFHVVEEAVPRIRRCVELLGDGELWRRHGRQGNSVGNLLLHLEGNVRQWILAGVGGAEDRRTRDAEFAAQAGAVTGEELVDRLAATAEAAAAIVDGLGSEELVASRSFQGRYERTVVEAVMHVLEHFSGHAYQIYAWTKEAKDVDLRFFDL
jgi:uncharacterized damage-inducible protein DinB